MPPAAFFPPQDQECCHQAPLRVHLFGTEMSFLGLPSRAHSAFSFGIHPLPICQEFQPCQPTQGVKLHKEDLVLSLQDAR